jgi:hypothetical protein
MGQRAWGREHRAWEFGMWNAECGMRKLKHRAYCKSRGQMSEVRRQRLENRRQRNLNSEFGSRKIRRMEGRRKATSTQST